jgi:hypothetical protein
MKSGSRVTRHPLDVIDSAVGETVATIIATDATRAAGLAIERHGSSTNTEQRISPSSLIIKPV